ncbi:MAG TPA: hypothetical protein ENN99_16745 [Chloroflexi bacterium]|nr:hypothetical protein [Chloroflexota bacterium]
MINNDQQGTCKSITVEVALWVLIGVVALAVRLYRVDAAPLSSHEAHEAMLAWRAVSEGLAGVDPQDYSPLLFAVNAGLMAVFGAGDGIVRLWAALCGTGLALAPLLFRRRLGRLGALAAGMYLVFSPTALFASRQVSGAVTAALGGLMALAGIVRCLDEEESSQRLHWIVFSALGLALAVTSSALTYGLLLPVGLVGLFTLARSGGGQRVWDAIGPYYARVFTIVALGAALMLATGMGWHWPGVGAVGDLLASWLARFRPAEATAASPLGILVIYEPLLLPLGIGGWVWSLRRSRRLGVLLGGGALTGLFLLFLMPGRFPLDILWVVLPLAMLAGLGVDCLAENLCRYSDWLSEGLHTLVVILLWGHLYLILARYAFSGNSVDLVLALAVVLMQFVMLSVFTIASGFTAALRAAAVGTGIVLLGWTISAGWGVAFVRPADPRELLTHHPSAGGVRDLVQTLQEISWQERGLPDAASFTYQTQDLESVLMWYLRDFRNARQVASLTAGVPDSLRVTVTDLPGDLEIPLQGLAEEEVIGQDFALRYGWEREGLGCTPGWPPQCWALTRWALFRKTSPAPPVDRWAVLWKTSHSD